MDLETACAEHTGDECDDHTVQLVIDHSVLMFLSVKQGFASHEFSGYLERMAVSPPAPLIRLCRITECSLKSVRALICVLGRFCWH